MNPHTSQAKYNIVVTVFRPPFPLYPARQARAFAEAKATGVAMIRANTKAMGKAWTTFKA